MQRAKTEEQMGDSMVDHTTEERVLPVPLTDDERLQIGADIAASQEQLEQAEARKSFVMKGTDHARLPAGLARGASHRYRRGPGKPPHDDH